MIRSPVDIPTTTAGDCKQCGTHLWSTDEPWAGRPGWRGLYLLSNQSQMDLTVCDACWAEPDLDRLWFAVLAAWRADRPDEERPDIARMAREMFIVAALCARRYAQVDKEDKLELNRG